MQRTAVAFGLVALISASVAIAAADAQPKLPTFICNSPDEPCEVATLIHASYSAPPAEAKALSSFAITLVGELRAPGDRGICKAHRKVEMPISWLRGSGASRSGPTEVTYTNGEGKFSLSMTVTAPAGSTGYVIPVEATGAFRKFKGKRTVCSQSEIGSGSRWIVEPENGWVWGGAEASPETP